MTDEITIEESKKQALIAETMTLQEAALTLASGGFSDDDDCRAGTQMIERLRARRDAIKCELKPIIEAAHKAHKAVTEFQARLIAPLTEADSALIAALRKYSDEKEAERTVKEAELQAQAQKAAEEKRLADAVKLEAQGKAEEANKLLDKPVVVQSVKLEKTTPLGNLTAKKKWVAEVVNVVALIKFVAAHPEYTNLLAVDSANLNRLATTQKNMARIDGVRFFEREDYARK